MRNGRTHTFEAEMLHALTLIAVSEGRILGRVKDPMLDPAEHRLVGVTVARRDGRGEDFLDARRARHLGPFAVTISATADLQTVESHDRARDISAADVKLRGMPVLADNGEPVGKLKEIWLRDDGSVAEYVTSARSFLFSRKRRLTPSDVIVIGTDVMIVYHSSIERRRKGAPAIAQVAAEAASEGAEGDG